QRKVFALGGGSAMFSGDSKGVRLESPQGALFAPGAVWGDVSIEFWLYPATLSDGETVLSWTGSVKAGDPAHPRLAAQNLRCLVKDRKITWDFQNFFVLPTGEGLPITLTGTRKLIPRVWHHHLLRYRSGEGLLEYLIDGVPEAIAHVTDTGLETGSVAVPRLGLEEAGPLVLGAGLTGFIDELRISRRAVDDPMIQRFAGKTGTATSAVIDLGFTATRIARIEAVYSTPGDSGVEFYYQVSDTWKSPKLLKTNTDWVPFVPPADFKDTLRGRYVQLMVVLYPDGTRNSSPTVSSVRVVYEPNEPPAPPAGLVAAPGNGKVILSWRPVSEVGVKGYSIYYGTSPHNYLGTGAAEGDSPVDAGARTSVEITGLTNGNLYYFAVTAYDGSEPPQRSEFSDEVSARPSRIYK
ncbi:MAG TPA: LamG-like jellyroll fold domain-containing protein, partial [Spirochaetia bacterium]|nr:LamG-like jellyroll fold domain-containing protein [Spirochaetia bacterium]